MKFHLKLSHNLSLNLFTNSAIIRPNSRPKIGSLWGSTINKTYRSSDRCLGAVLLNKEDQLWPLSKPGSSRTPESRGSTQFETYLIKFYRNFHTLKQTKSSRVENGWKLNKFEFQNKFLISPNLLNMCVNSEQNKALSKLFLFEIERRGRLKYKQKSWKIAANSKNAHMAWDAWHGPPFNNSFVYLEWVKFSRIFKKD